MTISIPLLVFVSVGWLMLPGLLGLWLIGPPRRGADLIGIVRAMDLFAYFTLYLVSLAIVLLGVVAYLVWM